MVSSILKRIAIVSCGLVVLIPNSYGMEKQITQFKEKGAEDNRQLTLAVDSFAVMLKKKRDALVEANKISRDQQNQYAKDKTLATMALSQGQNLCMNFLIAIEEFKLQFAELFAMGGQNLQKFTQNVDLTLTEIRHMMKEFEGQQLEALNAAEVKIQQAQEGLNRGALDLDEANKIVADEINNMASTCNVLAGK